SWSLTPLPSQARVRGFGMTSRVERNLLLVLILRRYHRSRCEQLRRDLDLGQICLLQLSVQRRDIASFDLLPLFHQRSRLCFKRSDCGRRLRGRRDVCFLKEVQERNATCSGAAEAGRFSSCTRAAGGASGKRLQLLIECIDSSQRCALRGLLQFLELLPCVANFFHNRRQHQQLLVNLVRHRELLG